MTMPSERTRAVLQTRDFLQWVMTTEATPENFEQAKREARNLLRHYPSSIHLYFAYRACPQWFGTTLDSEGSMSPGDVDPLSADPRGDL